MFQLLFLRPALGVEREFDAVRGDYDGADIWLGEVTDDVEGLEVVAEFVVLPDWDIFLSSRRPIST